MPASTAWGAALVSIVSILCIGASGCGGQPQDVPSILKQTFGPHPPVRSYNLDLALGIDVQGVKALTKPIALRVAGPYINSPPRQLPRFSLDVAINGSGQTFAANATTTSDKAFITIAGTPYVLPDPLFAQFKAGFTQTSTQSQGSHSTSFTALGLDPRTWLLSPRRLADTKVGDAQTIHIQSGVNVPRLLRDVNTLLARAAGLGISVPGAPKSITPAQQVAIAQSVRSATVDLYTGKDDRILRRLAVSVALAVPQPLQHVVGGLSTGIIVVNYQRTQLNRVGPINAPANAHPLSELLSAAGGAARGPLSSLAGAGATGAQGATNAAPGASAGAPSGVAPKAYLDCLSQANGDLVKIQGCAPLLNGG